MSLTKRNITKNKRNREDEGENKEKCPHLITHNECYNAIHLSLDSDFHKGHGVYVLLVESEYYDNQYKYLFKVGKCHTQSFFDRLLTPAKKYYMTDFRVLMINPNCKYDTEKNIKDEANALGLNANLCYEDGSKCTEYFKVDKKFINIVRKYGCFEAGELPSNWCNPVRKKIIPICPFMNKFFNEKLISEDLLNTAYNNVIDLTNLD